MKALAAVVLFIQSVVIFCVLVVSPASALVNPDLNNSLQYNLKYDNAATGVLAGNGGFVAADVNGNGKPDIIASDISGAYNGRSSSGAIYVIFDDLIDNYLSKGSYADVSLASNYSIRFEGAEAGQNMGHELVDAKDIDGNGVADIIFGAYHANPHGRGHAGTMYIVYDSLVDNYTGTGHNLDLALPTSYSINFEGATEHDHFGSTTIGVADFNHNGKMDLAVGGGTADYNGIGDSGSIWVIFDSVFNSLTGTGNVIDMADSGSFNIRFDGVNPSDQLGGYCLTVADVNNNNVPDIMVGAERHNSDAGAVYVIYDSIINSIPGVNNHYKLDDTSKYSLKITGQTGSRTGRSPISVADFDRNGKTDIVIPSEITDYNSQADSGSIYVLYDNVIDNFAGPGSLVDLTIPANYNIRFDGGVASQGYFATSRTGDMNGDGYTDLIANFPLQGTLSGNHYVIYNAQLNGGLTGQTKILSNSANYKYKFIGENFSFSGYVNLVDVNLDGKKDFLTGNMNADEPGGVFLIYNFPHSISLTLSSSIAGINTYTGTVSAPDSITKIAGVQYKLDNNSFGGIWSDCLADDTLFDSNSENFTCSVAINNLSAGHHRVYVRAYDENDSYTAQSKYVSSAFVINGPASSTNESNTLSILPVTSANNDEEQGQEETGTDVENNPEGNKVDQVKEEVKNNSTVKILLCCCLPVIIMLMFIVFILYYKRKSKKEQEEK